MNETDGHDFQKTRHGDEIHYAELCRRCNVNDIVPLEKVHALTAEKEIDQGFLRMEHEWVSQGIRLLTFDRNVWWRTLGYRSMDDFLEQKVGKSRAYCRGVMRNVRELTQSKIPVSEIQKLKISNCYNLVKIPTEKRINYVEQARTMSIMDFAKLVGKVKGNSQNGQEAKVHISLCFTESQMTVVDAAVEDIQEKFPDTSKSAAIALICGNYIAQVRTNGKASD